MESFQHVIDEFTEKCDQDLTHYSDIPEICKNKPCYVGIDEAGRGPVLGPMVYGIFCCVADEAAIKRMEGEGKTMMKIEENPPLLMDNLKNLTDSKQINEKIREEVIVKLVDMEYAAYGIKIISPAQISQKSFRRQKVSLNDVSHDAAIELIQGFIDRGVKISKVFVDTVGMMDKYQKKLEGVYPELQFKVDKKADSKYKTVSAASICAKVARDRTLKGWKYPENAVIALAKQAGSGYTSDPVTKKFLKANVDPIFGFPNNVRNSWSTASILLEKSAVKVLWENTEKDDESVSTPKISRYFGKADNSSESKVAIKKSQFFSYRELEQTTTL